MYLFISTSLLIIFNKRPDPVIDYLKTVDSKTVIPVLLIISIFLTLLSYVFRKTKTPIANAIDKHQYLKRAYNYYPILPLFMIGIGFLLVTFFVFNKLFSTFGGLLFWVGIFLFYIMFMLKTYYENKIFYTLHKANKILNDIDPDNKKSDSIRKFNKYFIKFLNNIDMNLKKGIKINDIIKEDKLTINMPVKTAIIYYLPVFMQFGNKEQICSLKNRVKHMLPLVKNNNEFDLTVSNIILDIYRDIEDFLKKNNFLVTEQKRVFSLSILRDRDLQTIIFGTVSIIISVLVRK
jgi:hypothetical protein